jgi:hypothetical protein
MARGDFAFLAGAGSPGALPRNRTRALRFLEKLGVLIDDFVGIRPEQTH